MFKSIAKLLLASLLSVTLVITNTLAFHKNDNFEKDKVGIVSQLDPETKWRVKDITQLKTFLKYLKAYSKIPVSLTKKLEGDIEGKINTELTNGQSRALKLRQSQQSVEGDDSLAEILRTSSIVEPVFIQGLKQVINEVTSGKLKFK